MRRRTTVGPGDDPETRVVIRRIEAAGCTVRVNTVGETGERAFVLVPGIGVSSHYFERLAPNLNGFGPVHALDLPGFGGLSHPGRALAIGDFADLVGQAIDELGLHDPILVGHSMGTQIVVELAASRPGFSTVVLIGPVVDRRSRTVPRQAICFLRSAWHEPWRVKLVALSAYVLCGVRWFGRVLPQMMRYPMEERVAELDGHVLIIRGEHDANAPRAWVRELARAIPRSKVWEMPYAAHSVMYAHAEEVAELCVRFARRPGADDDTVNVVDTDVESDPEPPLRPREAWAYVRGRWREWRGALRDDDQAIARGRTEQAEAQQRAMEDADERPGPGGGAGTGR